MKAHTVKSRTRMSTARNQSDVCGRRLKPRHIQVRHGAAASERFQENVGRFRTVCGLLANIDDRDRA